jgi:hypothetical protein
MRKPEEIMNRVTGDIRKLNARLLTVSIALDKESRRHPVARTPPGRILTSLYRKSVNTSRGIQFLKGEKLIEEAWILLRVLLETHVNFFYFLRNDPTIMCQRYADAAILDKLKHLREVDFYQGTSMASLHSRDKWEALEEEIRGRYTATELKALRRNGFSGLSFRDRASAIGLKIMYEICYRIASRSVHMFDPAETSIYSDYTFRGQAAERRELLRLRRQQLERNQNMLLGRMSYVIAQFTQNALRELELLLLGLGYEKYCGKVSGPVTDETADPPGSFRIWRV